MQSYDALEQETTKSRFFDTVICGGYMLFVTNKQPFAITVAATTVPILYFCISAVISEADEVAGLGEGIPGDVEPGGARQQLVGIGAGLEEIHEALELRGVLRANVGSLTAEVLRAADATHQTVHPAVAEARVHDDRADRDACRLQQHLAAIGHVHHVLQCRLVVRILLCLDEFAQLKVRR